jgi:DNA helicase II / ATP-dependent DNA helicase PcrA
VKRASKVLGTCEKKSENPLPALQSLLQGACDAVKAEDIFDLLTSKNRGDGMAVLCRYNSQILQLASKMQYLAYKKKKTIPTFRLNAGTPPRSLPSWISKLLYQYKTGQITRTNFIRAFRHVFPGGASEVPCGGDAETAWRLLLGYARYGEDDTSLEMVKLRERINWPDSLPDDEGEPDDVVTFSTIHQSKGLEYNSVRVVLGDSASDDAVDFHEEGRVLFVGMSRAREMLGLIELNDQYPFYNKTLDDGRSRWHRWIFNLQQLELGCDGDVNHEGIIRGDLMGGVDSVSKTQEFLAENESRLIGAPVTLEKTLVPGQQNRFHYRIVLEHEGSTWCLGFLHQFVTRDLLRLRTKKRWLPSRIHNLRVGAVTSISGNTAPHASVPSPWKESRFWLSVCIHGIGSA